MIRPRLVAITDPQLPEARLEALVAAALPGTVAIQLRSHELTAREKLSLGRRLRELTRRHGQALVINDRIDLASILEADGLHLGERSVRTRDARQLAPRLWLSRACHDPERVADEAVDAILLSPIIAARKCRPALGLDAIGRARALLGPEQQLFALGGIDTAAIPSILDAGADGVAAIGALAADPHALLDALGIRRRTAPEFRSDR